MTDRKKVTARACSIPNERDSFDSPPYQKFSLLYWCARFVRPAKHKAKTSISSLVDDMSFLPANDVLSGMPEFESGFLTVLRDEGPFGISAACNKSVAATRGQVISWTMMTNCSPIIAPAYWKGRPCRVTTGFQTIAASEVIVFEAAPAPHSGFAAGGSEIGQRG